MDFTCRAVVPRLLLLALATGPLAAASGESPEASTQPIVNGVLSWEDPAVALLGTGSGICSAVLVGCRTALTAAHCVCPTLEAAGCVDDPEATDPSRFLLFFQHAGFVGVERVSVAPGFVFDEGHDVAVLSLETPVTGVRPLEIGNLPDPAPGLDLSFAGFGVSDGTRTDGGLKRFGRGTTAACTTVPEATHVCLRYTEPVGAPGEDSSPCRGDSGGPLLLGERVSPVVVGVASGVEDSACRPPIEFYFTELAEDRDWIAAEAGPDLGAATCSDLPVVGGAGARILQGEGGLSPAARQHSFNFEVPAATREIRVSVNGEASKGNVDLYLRADAPPGPAVFDCASELAGPFEHCRVAEPTPGTWHGLVLWRSGAPRFQITTTLFESEPAPPPQPPPPAGPWLTSGDLPGFRAKARITPAGGAPIGGSRTEDCIAETLCVDGALPGRPEAFLKVIGPRLNGFLWVQISRFTPSEIELWVEQLATGELRYYRLGAVGPGDPDVSGLQDRQAFEP